MRNACCSFRRGADGAGTTSATPDAFGAGYGTIRLSCFFSGIGNVGTAQLSGWVLFPSGFPMAKVTSLCELQPRLLSMLRVRFPDCLCFSDINNVLDHTEALRAKDAAIACFAFHCEPFSTQGPAQGDK
jgi:hypothetical protein